MKWAIVQPIESAEAPRLAEGIATMVFPFLDARHLVTVPGNQQRVYGGQIRSVDLELLTRLRLEGFQQCAPDGRRVPTIFS